LELDEVILYILIIFLEKERAMLDKIFVAAAIVILVLTLIVLASGCGHKINTEKIIGKSFNKAHTETILLPVTHGEAVPVTVYHEDKWRLGTFSESRQRMDKIKWFDVSREVFEGYKLGDIVNSFGD
jgi:hypothetical protein